MTQAMRPLSCPRNRRGSNGAPQRGRLSLRCFARSERVLNTIDYQIRSLTPEDEPILWTVLYYGLNKGGSGAEPAPELVRQPEYARYVEGWGRPHDRGFVAYLPDEQDVIGAVWFRSPIPGPNEPQPGDEDAPELAYAVAPKYRRRGIGAALFTQWVRAHPDQSVLSLRVNSRNPVVRLYERFGFRVARETADGLTLRRD